MKRIFGASVAGLNPGTLFDSIASWPEFGELPFRVGMGHERVDPQNWRTIRDATNPTGGIAFWDDFEKQLATDPRYELISFTIPNWLVGAAEALDRILPLNFYLATFQTLFTEWLEDPKFDRSGFARKHIPFGWGCLIRGPGHDRLVSRRWLDFGPWRVVHLPNDTTFIQFHDLAIMDPTEAYDQARSGHERMGVDFAGGYIQSIDLDEFSKLEYVVYYKETQLLELVVAFDIEITQRNMWIACALRLHHRLTNQQDDRVERIAYVFMKRSDAELHLHELWLRELECWYVDEHGKHRLDLDYHPTPRPPAWVANLSANPVNALPESLG